MPDPRKPRRTKTGRVSSNKMNKTVVVAVDLVTRHRLYGRTLRRTRHFKAHDPGNQCQVGDTVIIAGKGHERSLCIGTTEYPWSDHAAARDALAALGYPTAADHPDASAHA